MENIDFKIYNPGGNKTGLVYNKNYSQEDKKIINDFILSKYKDVEQVGFIEKNQYEINMAGGEFCVNATRCAIFDYLAGKDGTIEIKVSGQSSKILGEISNGKVSATLVLNKNINELYEVVNENFFIKLDGIDFILINYENSKKYLKLLKKNEENAKKVLLEEMKKYNSSQKAEGIALLEKQGEKIKINPIVWVKTVDTLYYETACGSGSLAIAIYNFLNNRNDSISILQPSGYSIDIKLNIDNNFIQSAKVTGIVEEN